jgi:hypothetical protein
VPAGPVIPHALVSINGMHIDGKGTMLGEKPAEVELHSVQILQEFKSDNSNETANA